MRVPPERSISAALVAGFLLLAAPAKIAPTIKSSKPSPSTSPAEATEKPE
jgi:hypothetical protein